MKFDLFSRLFDEALDCDNIDMYIAERGWQDWMDSYSNDPDASKIVSILNYIYTMSRMSVAELRGLTGLSQPKFGAVYSIKRRTLQDWEYGNNRFPLYMHKLITYTLLEC